MIRNILMPLSSIGIFISVLLSLFETRVLQDTIISNLYASRLLFVVVLLSVLSIIAIIKMFKKDSKFIPMILSIEIILLLQYMQTLLQSIFATSDQVDFASSIPYIIVSALLIIYYTKSSRVKNTFVIT